MHNNTPNVCRATGRETFRVETVTPQMARRYFESNKGNRTLRKTTVDTYANAMLRGEWVFNGEGIAFDEDGLLANGQHRLAAIIQANVSVDMLVVDCVASKAKIAFDSHARRTVTDQVNLVGTKCGPIRGNTLTSVLNLLIDPSGLRVTSQQVAEAWDGKLGEGARWAVEGLKAKTNGVTIAPVFAGIASAYFYVDDLKRLQWFRDILIGGEKINLTESETAAPILREYLARTGRKTGRHDRTKKIAVVQHSVQKFMQRVATARQGVPQDAELIYPLPITDAAVR